MGNNNSKTDETDNQNNNENGLKDKFNSVFGNNESTTDINPTETIQPTMTTNQLIQTTTVAVAKKKKQTATVTATKTTSTATSTSTIEPEESEGGGMSKELKYGGIALGVIVLLLVIILIFKKMSKKSSSGGGGFDYSEQEYQSLKPQQQPPKPSGSMYTGPIYDPTKENYSSPVTMGVATSIDTASLQRKQKQEMDAASSQFNTGTLPSYNSPAKQPAPATSMPQTSMAQTYNYNSPQVFAQQGTNPQGYDNYGNYDQFNQQGGYQYGQGYDNVSGFNNMNNMNNGQFDMQYGNNYNNGMSMDTNTMNSLPLPVSSAGGVIVSATYASSQTTSVKNADGTVSETVDYATSNSYEVDRDYVAIYSYEPSMTDELAIQVNDRIHLLEMYSDGWGYGKNVTTGQIENKDFNDITKRTVSMNRRPKAAEEFNEKKEDRERRNDRDRRKRYSDDEDDYDRRRDRRRYDDDDDYERRRDRRRYDDDDDYERRRDRRRYDDDDYERRRDRRRYDDDDDYERRRDRRRYDDDDDYERRRDRRKYDDDDDYERRRDRRRYDDDDKKERNERGRDYERKKSYREENGKGEVQSPDRKKSYREEPSDNKESSDRVTSPERKKSYRDETSESKNSNENSPNYERKKSYREESSSNSPNYERKKSYREEPTENKNTKTNDEDNGIEEYIQTK
ncbi:hypothetical protein PIROE2DRAFT_1370 [Piromyces sp. E2]|nr:hypothetical protein PIROE2DRAFT_1370 [Piromyces sp. E2]|eukprot:OUM70499.1 hypothetical protein PIROE2DRAFT_1370 [Piromyces sp. E2]